MTAAPAWEEIRPDATIASIIRTSDRAITPEGVVPVEWLDEMQQQVSARVLPMPRLAGVQTAADIVAEMDPEEIEAQNLIAAMRATRANHWQIEARLQDGSRWVEVYFGPYRNAAEFAVSNHDDTRAFAHTRGGWTPVEPIEETA